MARRCSRGPEHAELIRHTLKHLDEAIAYTAALPRDQIGIRTFLLGSILPAVATLEIAARAGHQLSKIDRATMQALLAFVEASAHDNDNIRRSFYEYYRSRCMGVAQMLSSHPADLGGKPAGGAATCLPCGTAFHELVGHGLTGVLAGGRLTFADILFVQVLPRVELHGWRGYYSSSARSRTSRAFAGGAFAVLLGGSLSTLLAATGAL